MGLFVVLRSQLAMPKSKRNKVVTLVQTTKKGMGRKQELAEDIREALENYQRVFVFSTNNMRNTALKEVRQEWKHSRYEQSPSNASRNSPPDSVCFPFSLLILFRKEQSDV